MKTSLSLVVLWVGLAVPAPQVHGQDYDFYTNIDETITIIRYLGPGADVVIPNTIDGRLVTAIGAPAGPAFAGPAVRSITIPGTVTEIRRFRATGDDIPQTGPYAFYGCSNLEAVHVDPSNLNYSSVSGVLLNKPQTRLLQCPAGKQGDYMIPRSVTTIEEYAFLNCANLRSICFEGDTPSVPTWSQGVLGGTEATVSYLPGSIGWNATFCGRPTAVWLPQILSDDSSFGVRDNEFGSTINWARSKTVVIEAATSLANPSWLPVSTNTLVEGPAYFSDAEWTNYPARFYRVRAQ